MFLVELTFGPDQSRLAARPAHRDLLAALHTKGQLCMAGPWPDDSGALLIFDTDQAGVDAILAADPYYSHPGVTVASVREWQPLFSPAS
jgi:uncharacterized protein YciI